ncbi:MAG: hydroxymethylglutaryl-CoA lyase [Paracoccaceae bacterium]|nr:hydroxymethylglutaryl-CoA lyase [Paracoccaceae bacterium]
MTRDVTVRDVGPRDGLQLVKAVVPTQVKLDWIAADRGAGLPEVEVCSFVPAKVIPQFADAIEVATEAAGIGGLIASALTPNLKGAEIGFKTGIQKINYVMSVSETHNQSNVRRTREESLEGFKAIIALRDAEYPGVSIGIGLATALGCTFEGRVPEAESLKWLGKVLEAGADEVALPDTVGYAHPAQVRSIFAKAADICGDVPLWSHFHDTRGLGIANALAALEAGCTRFDASLAGLGGCPFAPGATGNIALEDLVFLLEAEGLKTGIDIAALAKPRAIVEAALADEPKHGHVLQAGLPKGFVPSSAIAAE